VNGGTEVIITTHIPTGIDMGAQVASIPQSASSRKFNTNTLMMTDGPNF
jgi:hypothetical protein